VVDIATIFPHTRAQHPRHRRSQRTRARVHTRAKIRITRDARAVKRHLRTKNVRVAHSARVPKPPRRSPQK
jgi:hypothetical protein